VVVASLPTYFQQIMIYGRKTFGGGCVLTGSPAPFRQEKNQSADNERNASNDKRQPDRVHQWPSFLVARCNEDDRLYLAVLPKILVDSQKRNRGRASFCRKLITKLPWAPRFLPRAVMKP
jgi:hypothetical protein